MLARFCVGVESFFKISDLNPKSEDFELTRESLPEV